MTNYKTLIVGFIVSYAALFTLGYFEIFKKWDSWLFWLGIFAIYFIGYFAFEFLQKEIEFNFAEAYIGLVLLLILFLGYWAAFRIYYGNIATLNSLAYSDFYTQAGLNMFKTMINSVYIHIALSFFGAWVAFYIDYAKKKE